jgi:hypothetical protein
MDHYEEVTCDCLACHISRTENEGRNDITQITKTENEERNKVSPIPKVENEETNFQGENDDDDSNYNYSYDDAVTAEMK